MAGNHVLACLLSASVLAGCAVASDKAGSTTKPRTLAEWEQCEKTTGERLDRECKAQGLSPGDCFGAGGAGLEIDIRAECGPKPGITLDENQRRALDEHCWWEASLSKMAQAELRSFYDYGVGSRVWKLAEEECARIYAANADRRAAEGMQSRKEDERRKAEKIAASKKPVNVERAYQSSSEFVGVVIRTKENRIVKCALLNSEGDYLRVESAIITAPVDEMLIRTGGIPWSSVRCWY